MNQMILILFAIIVIFSQSPAIASTTKRNSEIYGELPVIDISSLLNSEQEDNNILKNEVIKKIGDACRHEGFFYIVNHGVPVDLQQQLETSSETFFATETVENKEKIAMTHG
jgi:isopenicillin N synthase-like dioxygenase